MGSRSTKGRLIWTTDVKEIELKTKVLIVLIFRIRDIARSFIMAVAMTFKHLLVINSLVLCEEN